MNHDLDEQPIAVIDGDKVFLLSKDVEYTLTYEEFEYAKAVLEHGIDKQYLNNIIRPCDIIGYLFETNPEAENVVVEEEVSIAKRSMDKDSIRIMTFAFAALLVIIGGAIAYMMISDGGSSAPAAVSTATSGLSL
jgi:hypothetical protein